MDQVTVEIPLSLRIASLMEDGGAVMWPLALTAIVLWFGLGFRAATLFLAQPLDRGRWPFPVAPLASHALPTVLTGRSLPVDRRRRFFDATLYDFRAELSSWVPLIRTLITAAPLWGLLGTVMGMVETFAALGEGVMHSQGGGIASGIAEALITTQVGLVIAIPGLLAERLLERRQKAVEADLERLVNWALADAPAPQGTTA